MISNILEIKKYLEQKFIKKIFLLTGQKSYKESGAKNIFDKAISAGEGTNLKINNVFFENVGVGIASKDGSNVIAKNCTTQNPLLSSYMTYIKKNNYSFPTLNLENCKFILSI